MPAASVVARPAGTILEEYRLSQLVTVCSLSLYSLPPWIAYTLWLGLLPNALSALFIWVSALVAIWLGRNHHPYLGAHLVMVVHFVAVLPLVVVTGGPTSYLLSAFLVLPLLGSSLFLPGEPLATVWSWLSAAAVLAVHIAHDMGALPVPDKPTPHSINTALCLTWVFLGTVMPYRHARALTDAMQAAQDSEARAVRESQHKSEFLSKMSHEMRTPLMGITGWVDIVMQSTLSREQTSCLSAVLNCTHHLQHVIDSVLFFGSLEANSIPVRRALVNVAARVSSVLLSVHPSLSASANMRLFLAVPDDHDMQLATIDPMLYDQCLLNLLSNSIKFTSDGHVSVVAYVTSRSPPPGHCSTPPASAGRSGRWLVSQVADTGIGMSEHQIQSVLKPFVQADDTIRRRFGGTGLGLSITRELVERMEGHLYIESQKGQGTVVTFWLPIDRDSISQSLDIPAWDCPDILFPTRTPEPLRRLGCAKYEVRVKSFGALSNSSWAAQESSDPSPRPNPAAAPPAAAIAGRPHMELLRSSRRDLAPTSDEARTSLTDGDAPGDRSSHGTKRPAGADHGAGQHKRARETAFPVVVCEDNVVCARILTTFVKKLGRTAGLFESGISGVQYFAEADRTKLEAVQLVIMDIHMPELDGISAIRQITDIYEERGIPPPDFVVSTADISVKKDTLSVKVAAVLFKPYTMGSLGPLLDRATRKRRGEIS